MKRLWTRRSAGVSLTDLLVVAGLIPLGVVLFFGCQSRMHHGDNRLKCSANLKSIGQALLLYAGDNKGQYPRTRYVSGPVVIPKWGTRAATTQPFAPEGPEPNDVTAAIFLLLNTAELTPEVFTCPTSSAEKWDFGGGINTSHNWSNWEGQKGIVQYLSYSMQNPYPDDQAVRKGFKWDSSLSADYAIVADINPGVGTNANVLSISQKSGSSDMRQGNSTNHDRSGQNILYGDGHVDWSNNPFAGKGGDNIYARRAGPEGDKSIGVKDSPFDGDDNVLLPTDH